MCVEKSWLNEAGSFLYMTKKYSKCLQLQAKKNML